LTNPRSPDPCCVSVCNAKALYRLASPAGRADQLCIAGADGAL
jgi:hypothetical protein